MCCAGRFPGPRADSAFGSRSRRSIRVGILATGLVRMVGASPGGASTASRPPSLRKPSPAELRRIHLRVEKPLRPRRRCCAAALLLRSAASCPRQHRRCLAMMRLAVASGVLALRLARRQDDCKVASHPPLPWVEGRPGWPRPRRPPGPPHPPPPGHPNKGSQPLGNSPALGAQGVDGLVALGYFFPTTLLAMGKPITATRARLCGDPPGRAFFMPSPSDGRTNGVVPRRSFPCGNGCRSEVRDPVPTVRSAKATLRADRAVGHTERASPMSMPEIRESELDAVRWLSTSDRDEERRALSPRGFGGERTPPRAGVARVRRSNRTPRTGIRSRTAMAKSSLKKERGGSTTGRPIASDTRDRP
jgi:hypothetical protein